MIILTCPRDDNGVHYARELAHEQTLENLQAFSDKLVRGYALMKAAEERRKKETP